MTTGRKLRLALGAAILAALFVFGVVGHSGVHGTTSPVDPPCAMCGAAAEAVSSLVLSPPTFDAPRLLCRPVEAPVERASLLFHRPRGPPFSA